MRPRVLFAQRGVDAVSLRDIAAEADVHFALIRRYIGNRDELVTAVFDDLSDQLAASGAGQPAVGSGIRRRHGDGQVGAHRGRARDRRPAARGSHRVQPGAGDGPDPHGRLRARRRSAARLRAAQIVAAALGWRIFEDYLVAAGELGAVPLDTLREELVHSARRLGATPWPSPPDPSRTHALNARLPRGPSALGRPERRASMHTMRRQRAMPHQATGPRRRHRAR